MMRDLAAAEKWYLESKTIREKSPGKENLNYALSVNNLGILYYDLGDYKKSEQFYLETKVIRETVLGIEHPAYAALQVVR